VSGAHLNPAVTVGLWSVRKIKAPEALAYIAAQLVGAVLAQFLFQYLMGGLPPITVAHGWAVALAEALGAFFLVFAVSAVVHGKVHQAASGLVVGGSLLLGILLASLISNGVLNPAVAIGIRSFSLAYMIGPLAGAVVAVFLYQWVTKE
jgi:glycerol uptake facilitator protein